MSKIIYVLQKPFPLQSESLVQLRSSVVFGVFVGLFLFLFKPFGLSESSGNLMWISAVFGLVTFAGMAFTNLIVKPLAPSFYSETSWNSGREITHTMVTIVLIALGNFAVSVFLGFVSFSPEGFAVFLGFTVLVGLFPVTIRILLLQNKLEKKFSGQSNQMNAEIAREHEVKSLLFHQIEILDEDGKTALTINPDHILAVESADNYVKFYLAPAETQKSLMIRNSLNSLEEQLEITGLFFRTHRSYILNIDKVEQIQGNARGLAVRMRYIDIIFPVARRRTEAFRTTIETR